MQHLTEKEKALLFDLHVRGSIVINTDQDFDGNETYSGYALPELFDSETEDALDSQAGGDVMVTVNAASVEEVTPFFKAAYREFWTKPGIDEFDIKKLIDHQREQYGRGSFARRLKNNLSETIASALVDHIDDAELAFSCLKKTKVTPMPEWLGRQLDNAEQTVASWSDAKCEAAGIPRARKEPWKPNDGERYFLWLEASETVHSQIWHGLNYDYVWLKEGNCHKTAEEAKRWGKMWRYNGNNQ